MDDVDQVEHHAALAPHDHVEVAQADVEVDHDLLFRTNRDTSIGNLLINGFRTYYQPVTVDPA